MLSQEEIRNQFDQLLEKELEYHLQKLGSGNDAAELIGEVIELAYKQDPRTGEHMRSGLDIIMPEILKRTPAPTKEQNVLANVQDILAACQFGAHYRQTRDLIYCSYKSPGAVTWEFTENKFKITVNDRSFFRQITCETQAFLMNSIGVSEKLSADSALELSKNDSYWDLDNTKTIELLNLFEQDAETKIAHYFDYIPRDSTVDIGGYAYTDFLKVFRSILIVALYERTWNATHDSGSVIVYGAASLAQQMSDVTGITEEICQKILRDLATASRGTLNYIADADQYQLFPTSFSLVDHMAEILKQYAKRDEKGFSSGCASLIGDALVEKVAGYFTQYPNFKVTTEVNLQKFDKSLPDIDVLTMSYEPTFGFQIFVSEVKNNLPATWAKEHLKHSDKKGALIKAVSQIEKLKVFLSSTEGASLLHGIIKNAYQELDFETLFPTGFMATLNFLIVTPQNIGVLMPAGENVIVNDDFLRHLIRKCDGDSIYLKHHFDHINTLIDESYTVTSDTFLLGEVEVTYDRAELKHLIAFDDHEYLSAGRLEEIEKEGLDSGYSYINTLVDHPDSTKEPKPGH